MTISDFTASRVSSGRPAILVFNDYFCPAFKGGGPVRSLANLVSRFNNEYDFYVVCRTHDLEDKTRLAGIRPGEWQDWENKCQVFYWDPGVFDLGTLIQIARQVQPDIVYINGIFSFFFNLMPLLLLRKKFVIAPRGMLFDEALSSKAFKKRLYLFFFRKIVWLKEISWQANEKNEAMAIRKNISSRTRVRIAENIPSIRTGDDHPIIEKKKNILRIVYLSLITPNKNLHLVLEALKHFEGHPAKIEFDIFGPVKDRQYWKQCLALFASMPGNIKVQYKGSVAPSQAIDTISRYHTLVLPSSSENFGHAIYETFLAKRPVITSNFTPWKELEVKEAGWNIDIQDEAALRSLFEKLLSFDQDQYDPFCKGASALASGFLQSANFEIQYKNLFLGNADCA
ncbi:MAG: glycosyltransferase family 4 protein [Bacteroidetes bacterium]|nr:glycosyltransferase family 4 protein [Bacteroidota bacterium]